MTRSAQFRIEGFNRVRNNLRGMATGVPEITSPVLRKYARKMRDELKAKPYPVKLVDQTYERRITDGLKGGFYFKKSPSRADAFIIGNKAKDKSGRQFSKYVIGAGHSDLERDASEQLNTTNAHNQRYHRGRWWTVREVTSVVEKEMVRELTEAIKRKYKLV